MGSKLKLMVFSIVAIMILASALPGLADNDVNGNWSGSWNGNGKTGVMSGYLKEADGVVTGSFTLKNTVKGDLTGPLQGTISEFGQIEGSMTVQSMTLKIEGDFALNNITGGFSNSELGDGDFSIDRKK